MARKLHKRELDLTPSEAQDLALFMIKHEDNNIRITWDGGVEGGVDADVTAHAVYYAGVDEEEILDTRTLGK